MGVEVWAFAALIAVLVAYLLPFLVRRREIAGQSHVQDRYSAELRLLDTGLTAADPDEACERSGHAELFRRRPEVKAMNRPAVRNVRALRTERELTRARKAHAQARERRRVAASHRGVVACALLGVALGAWVIGALTSLPWWPALVPTVLLGVSMVAGRRAAKASASADRRERQRIAELERELRSLTGRGPSVPVVSAAKAQETGSGGRPQGPRRPDFDEAVLSAEGASSVHVAPRFVQESFRARARADSSSGSSRQTVSGERERTGKEPQEHRKDARTGRSARADDSGGSADRAEDGAGARSGATEKATEKATKKTARKTTGTSGAPRDAGGAARRGGEATAPAGSDDSGSRSGSRSSTEAPGAQVSAGAPQRREPQAGSTARQDRATSGGQAQSAERPAPGRRKAPEAKDSQDSGAGSSAAWSTASSDTSPAGASATEPEPASASATLSPATPPQGWKPVHVPAPTYTLAPRAPRRAYSEPVLDEGESAPVPARPHTVRTFSTPDFEEQDFQPIDLDAILERRRAAGE